MISAVSGYADTAKSYQAGAGPTYSQVSSEEVRAREAVQVIYDPTKISIPKILELYFRHINPVDSGGMPFERIRSEWRLLETSIGQPVHLHLDGSSRGDALHADAVERQAFDHIVVGRRDPVGARPFHDH